MNVYYTHSPKRWRQTRGSKLAPNMGPLIIYLLIFQAHNRLLADLDSNGFLIEETQSFATEVRTALSKLKEKDVRIILGNFNETWALKIFCEAYK